ncbi:hypothetical protein BDD12DRAFT_879389 [Trichophaea hybrida]|nr:hypothetical protein BDD12DRAFT_879389 [Trichophaea hybrida]
MLVCTILETDPTLGPVIAGIIQAVTAPFRAAFAPLNEAMDDLKGDKMSLKQDKKQLPGVIDSLQEDKANP